MTNLTGATMLSYSKTTLDADGETVADVDGNGQTTSYIYDDLGRKISTTDALGNVVEQTTYDNDGREISSEDGNNHTTTSFYDNDGQLLNTTYPDGTQSSTTYDALGRRAATTDQAGLTTQYVYDNLGRLTSVATPLGNTETYTYDEIGEKLTQTDANGHTTSFVYDLNGRLVQKTLPLGMSMYQTYNLDGSLASVTDYNGNTVAMGYDSAGRLTGKYQGSLTGPQLASLTYNTDGSLHSKTKGSVTTTYAYDALGRTTSVTNANTGTNGLTTSVGYTYDTASNKLTQTSTYGSSNTTVTYAYDADERLSQVTAPDSTVTKYAFDNAGNRASVVRPNGITTNYKYDSLNRLTDVINQKTATGAIVSSYHYTLGPSGKRLDVTDQNGNITAYTYDNDGRLIGESSAAVGNVVYSYDNVGNRITKSVNGSVTQTFTFDSNDRVTNSGYNYDNDGNVLNDTTNTYTWDWENKLTGTNAGRSNAATYVSDYDGIRVQQTTSGGTTNYTIDPESGYGNVIEERSGAGTLNARYDYGDDLVRMDRGSGVYYYIFDGLGSTRQLTDASGNVDNTDNYDAFGNIISSTGSVVNPYLFDGQEQDGTGLYYLRARYLDPERGEFLSQDPFDGYRYDPASLHRYVYASDDPVDMSDPGGEDDIAEIGIAESISVGLDALDVDLGAEATEEALEVGVEEQGDTTGIFAQPLEIVEAPGITPEDAVEEDAKGTFGADSDDPPSNDEPSNSNQTRQNPQKIGAAREKLFQQQWFEQNEGNGKSLLRERYLRGADGKRLVDTNVTGEARRLDFVEVGNGKVDNVTEVTGENVDKTLQEEKTLRIREANPGNVYVRIPGTKYLLQIPDNLEVSTERYP